MTPLLKLFSIVSVFISGFGVLEWTIDEAYQKLCVFIQKRNALAWPGPQTYVYVLLETRQQQQQQQTKAKSKAVNLK